MAVSCPIAHFGGNPPSPPVPQRWRPVQDTEGGMPETRLSIQLDTLCLFCGGVLAFFFFFPSPVPGQNPPRPAARK